MTTAISEGSTRVSGRRFVAHFVDGILFAIAFVVVVLVFALLPEGPVVDALLIAVLALGLTVGHIWFLVLLHQRDGRSPGKRLVGIRVVDENGQTPDAGALWKRFVPVLVEYFYVIAWIGMMASPFRQRFGDRWAHTYVVDG
jgi:uncharacterized RDD family membrane protein YckC